MRGPGGPPHLAVRAYAAPAVDVEPRRWGKTRRTKRRSKEDEQEKEKEDAERGWFRRHFIHAAHKLLPQGAQ